MSEHTHAELMRAIGARSFDPMPPSQHAFLLGNEEPMSNRAIAWIWSKTIHPGTGHHRSPYARDRRGALTHVHAAHDLGWTVKNARVVFEKLIEQGRIRKDEEGRFWLVGNVPEPRQTKGEDSGQGICTYPLPPSLVLYFQQHPKTETQQWEGEWNQLQEFKKKVLADAIALGREQADAIEERWYAKVGFEPDNGKPAGGRPKIEPEKRKPVVQLSLLDIPSFVHIPEAAPEHDSVQNGKGVPYETENGSVRNAHPYGSENQSFRGGGYGEESQSFKVGEWEEEHPPTEAQTEPIRQALTKVGFPVPATDTLLEQLADLGAAHELPPAAIAEAIEWKIGQRRLAEKPTHSAGAVLSFLKKDLPSWIAEHPHIVAFFRRRPEEQPETVTDEQQVATLEDLLLIHSEHPQADEWRAEIERLKKGRAKKAGQG
jgi:hypothetical protein